MVLQFASLEHFAHDITAADKLTFYVKLRNCWPGRVFLDALLDQLDARRSELLGLNEQLDERVRQRTADLQAANQKLHQAVEQLLASEKLAALGQLTAGIAHEFNNPLAIMMGHLDLIRMTLNDPESLKTVRLLDEQVHRMRNIVQKLLQFLYTAC
eukprot:gene2200-3135_t